MAGKYLDWQGRCGFIAACTDVIDRSHASLAIMGPRFLFVRIPSNEPIGTMQFKFENRSHAAKVGREMREATSHLITSEIAEPYELKDPADIHRMANLATLLSYSRSAVYWDRMNKREIEFIPEPEFPIRAGEQLAQIWEAGGMLGLTEPECWEIVSRLALDSIPYVREPSCGLSRPARSRSRRLTCGQVAGSPGQAASVPLLS